MKVAIVYDRVNKWGGAERVLLTLHEIFPKAPLYTSVYSKKNAKWAKVFPTIYTSFLQQIPFAKNNHELFALLMPFAFSFHIFDNYDLVISVTSEFAKNINVKTGKHVCYCLTPTRYLWSHFDEYFKDSRLKLLAKPVVNYFRKIDKKIAQKPDIMIAISTEVQKRIRKYYGRKSKIIFPPVEIKSISNNFFENDHNYFLIVSRLVGYKKVDLVIEAFNELSLPLVVIGTGREEKKLRRIAKKNIKFLGKVNDDRLVNSYKHAKALIFPQEEDFGITVVEAGIFGVPVIAYKKGGALDTVIENKTGIFFKKQDKQSLIAAISKFSKLKFDKKIIKERSKKFSKKRFKEELLQVVKSL